MVGVLKFGVLVKCIFLGIIVWYICLLKWCFNCFEMLFVSWFCGLYIVCNMFLIFNLGFIIDVNFWMVFIRVVNFFNV